MDHSLESSTFLNSLLTSTSFRQTQRFPHGFQTSFAKTQWFPGHHGCLCELIQVRAQDRRPYRAPLSPGLCGHTLPASCNSGATVVLACPCSSQGPVQQLIEKTWRKLGSALFASGSAGATVALDCPRSSHTPAQNTSSTCKRYAAQFGQRCWLSVPVLNPATNLTTGFFLPPFPQKTKVDGRVPADLENKHKKKKTEPAEHIFDSTLFWGEGAGLHEDGS